MESKRSSFRSFRPASLRVKKKVQSGEDHTQPQINLAIGLFSLTRVKPHATTASEEMAAVLFKGRYTPKLHEMPLTVTFPTCLVDRYPLPFRELYLSS